MTASKVLAANPRSGGNHGRETAAAGSEVQLCLFGLPSSGMAAGNEEPLVSRQLAITLAELIHLTEHLGSDGLHALCLYLAHLQYVTDAAGQPAVGVPHFSAAWLRSTSERLSANYGALPMGKNAAARAQQVLSESGFLTPIPNKTHGAQVGARGRTWRAVIDLHRLGVDNAQSTDSRPSRIQQHRGRPPGPSPRSRITLDELRDQRQRRRDVAWQRLMNGRAPATWLKPHAVYLIHIEEQNSFKVGISSRSALRVHQFARWPQSVTVVDHLVVENRGLAEIIEVEVLSAVEPWHVLGDRESPGGGYTEMWSDRGPTVDLTAFRHYVNRSLEAGRGP